MDLNTIRVKQIKFASSEKNDLKSLRLVMNNDQESPLLGDMQTDQIIEIKKKRQLKRVLIYTDDSFIKSIKFTDEKGEVIGATSNSWSKTLQTFEVEDGERLVGFYGMEDIITKDVRGIGFIVCK